VANKHKERMFLLHGSCLSLFCLCWYQSWFADVDAVEKGLLGGVGVTVGPRYELLGSICPGCYLFRMLTTKLGWIRAN
jgi:hypothetical protein